MSVRGRQEAGAPVLASPASMRLPQALIPVVFQATRFTLRPVCRKLWGLELTGREHIPRGGPLIVCANHASLLDAFVLIAAVDLPIVYVITWDFYGPLLSRWIFWLLGTIPIGGPNGVRGTVRSVASVLRVGGVVGLFPEGRISRDGTLQPFQKGVARVALRSGAPILPVYIDGSFDAMPRWARWPKRSPIRVRVGPSLAPVPAGDVTGEEVRSLTRRLEAAIGALAPS